MAAPGGRSLPATVLKLDTELPAKTPRSVSKLEPAVLIVTVPDAGAVQLHQTEWPPPLPTMVGSAASRLALTLVPPTLMDEPLMTVRLLKLSLIGPAAVSETLRVTLPVAPL